MWNLSEGTLYAEAQSAFNIGAASSVVFGADNNATAERMQIRKVNTEQANFVVLTGGVTQANATVTPANSFATFTNHKVAGAGAVNNFICSLNGATSALDTTGTMPTPTQFTIGYGQGAALGWSGSFKRVIYWPRRLSDGIMRGLTQ
jgi:hypothetical protein